MINNIRHNYMWLISALETYGLAAYFILTHSAGNFTPPPNSVLDMLDDPPFIFLLGVVGTITLVYSVWNVQHFHYKTIMTASLTFVWLLFLCGFVIHDQMRGLLLSIPSMYSFFVLFRIVPAEKFCIFASGFACWCNGAASTHRLASAASCLSRQI